VNAYNKAVGSFDSRILPGARKFAELGIAAKTEVTEPDQVERAARTVQSADTPTLPESDTPGVEH
jgi:DNA recombination protein RmuC